MSNSDEAVSHPKCPICSVMFDTPQSDQHRLDECSYVQWTWRASNDHLVCSWHGKVRTIADTAETLMRWPKEASDTITAGSGAAPAVYARSGFRLLSPAETSAAVIRLMAENADLRHNLKRYQVVVDGMGLGDIPRLQSENTELRSEIERRDEIIGTLDALTKTEHADFTKLKAENATLLQECATWSTQAHERELENARLRSVDITPTMVSAGEAALERYRGVYSDYLLVREIYATMHLRVSELLRENASQSAEILRLRKFTRKQPSC